MNPMEAQVNAVPDGIRLYRILVTAFEPFDGDSLNASLECARRLRPPKGTALFVREAPVVFSRCGDLMSRWLEETKPDAVLCLGQAAGRRGVSIERIAVNLMDARIPDNAGAQPRDLPIRPEGPDGLFATLPVRRMLDALAQRDIPAFLSDSAGTYVCNCLMYETLYLIRERGLSAIAGFVHIPSLREQGKDGFAMPLETAAEAAETCLQVLAAQGKTAKGGGQSLCL